MALLKIFDSAKSKMRPISTAIIIFGKSLQHKCRRGPPQRGRCGRGAGRVAESLDWRGWRLAARDRCFES